MAGLLSNERIGAIRPFQTAKAWKSPRSSAKWPLLGGVARRFGASRIPPPVPHPPRTSSTTRAPRKARRAPPGPAQRRNESFFEQKVSKSHRSMIEKQPRAPKEPRTAPNHARITGALALISSHVAWIHVFCRERDRKYRARVFRGDTRHVLARSKNHLQVIFRYCAIGGRFQKL